MRNGISNKEHWITAGLIALAVILMSFLPLSAGTAMYSYDSTGQLSWIKNAAS